MYDHILNQIKSIKNQKSTRIYAQIQPNPPKSNQSSSMPSKSSQTHPNMLPFLHASSEIIQIQHKSTYICPLNKSTVILSSLHKCYRIYWNRPDPPKQLEFIKNQTTPIKFTKPNSNIPKSIRIHSNLPNRWNRVKSAQINNTKFQQNRCKSTRSVLSLKSSRGH